MWVLMEIGRQHDYFLLPPLTWVDQWIEKICAVRRALTDAAWQLYKWERDVEMSNQEDSGRAMLRHLEANAIGLTLSIFEVRLHAEAGFWENLSDARNTAFGLCAPLRAARTMQIALKTTSMWVLCVKTPVKATK